MERDITFDIVDQKLQYLLEATGINYNLIDILNGIIEKADDQNNREYMEALEKFENEYIKPRLN